MRTLRQIAAVSGVAFALAAASAAASGLVFASAAGTGFEPASVGAPFCGLLVMRVRLSTASMVFHLDSQRVGQVRREFYGLAAVDG